VGTEPWGRKGRLIRDVTSTVLGKEEMVVPNSLKEGAVWHIGTLLDNDCEPNNKTTAVARQQPTQQ
jgi:hypothetical protein